MSANGEVGQFADSWHSAAVAVSDGQSPRGSGFAPSTVVR